MKANRNLPARTKAKINNRMVKPSLIGIEQRGKLLDEIIERAKYRTKAELQSWRTALYSAENIVQPQKQWLLKIYDEISLDPHLIGLIENGRKAAVKCEEFQLVDKNGKVNKEATDLLTSEWFYNILDFTLDSNFWGHSLVDIKNIDGKIHAELVPRVHVEPVYGQLLTYPEDYEGIVYRDNALLKGYFIEIGKTRNLGLYNAAVPMVLFKKNAMIAWSEYCDIFGMPFRSAYTTSNRKEDLDRLENELMNMGKAAYGVFRKDIEEFKVEKMDGNGSGSGNNIYDQLAERANSELSKLILGSTMTSDVGKNGSRAQADVHEHSKDAVIEMDKLLITFTVNDQLLPTLIARGVQGLEGLKFIYPKKENRDQLVKHLDVIMKHKDVPGEFILEKLGIPTLDKPGENVEPEQRQKPAEEKSKKVAVEKSPTNSASEVMMKMHHEIAVLLKDKCC